MKRHLKIIALGIPLGIILIIMKNSMNMDDDVFFKNYIIFGIVVVAVAVIINCLHQIRFVKKLSNLTKMVIEEENLELFFEEIEKLLKKYKSKYNRSLLLINLSYGYAKKKDYAKGLEVLKSIEPKNVKGINKIVYNLNLSCFNFHLGNYEEVISITEKSNKVFLKFKNSPYLGWNVASNDIYYCIAKEEYEDAETLLEEAKSKWNSKKEMKEEWEMLTQVLDNKILKERESNKEY